MQALIRTVLETGSTNADMIALARNGAEEGLWLRAERQTSGRGRLGRDWQSPEGNFYGSTIVRLRAGDPPAPTLAFVAAVALFEVVRAEAPLLPLSIKWPNDVLVGGAKLSGILLERSNDAVVIGIGVNLAHHPEGLERPVTSLAAQGIAPEAPERFAEALAAHFAVWVAKWREEGLSVILRAWEGYAHPVGTPVTAALPDGTELKGRYDGLDRDAALKLRLADGSSRAIHAGDVFLV